MNVTKTATISRFSQVANQYTKIFQMHQSCTLFCNTLSTTPKENNAQKNTAEQIKNYTILNMNETNLEKLVLLEESTEGFRKKTEVLKKDSDPIVYECKHCFAIFDCCGAFQRHIQKCKGDTAKRIRSVMNLYNEPQFFCCRRVFHHLQSLNRHLQGACTLQRVCNPRYRCGVCYEKCTRLTKWATHVSISHSEYGVRRSNLEPDTSYVCNKCGATFTEQLHIMTHKVLCRLGNIRIVGFDNQKDRSYQCEYCNVRLSDVQSLRNHKALHVSKGDSEESTTANKNYVSLKTYSKVKASETLNIEDLSKSYKNVINKDLNKIPTKGSEKNDNDIIVLDDSDDEVCKVVNEHEIIDISEIEEEKKPRISVKNVQDLMSSKAYVIIANCCGCGKKLNVANKSYIIISSNKFLCVACSKKSVL